MVTFDEINGDARTIFDLHVPSEDKNPNIPLSERVPTNVEANEP